MQYSDDLYGQIEINEAVLLDLMASDAMLRIKGISQHGITAVIGITSQFTRFDHSVGTMLLVGSLGATIDEQIAALLHDISHTAFSHVIDFVYDDHNGQGYHEKMKEEIVANSDIPEIMGRYGMDWRQFMDEDRFPILEQPLPALCADRLDYFFRDLEFLNLGRPKDIQNAVASLTLVQGRIAVNNIAAARWLAYTFIEADRESWSSIREVGLYQVTAEAIKAARQAGIIGEKDLWHSDKTLWEKLRSTDFPVVKDLVTMISPGTRFIWNDDLPAFRVETKVRSIDPLVVIDKSALPLTALDSAFDKYRKGYLAGKRGQWPIEIVGAPGSA